MKLILTRHGETFENAAGIIQGHLPGKLSPLGKRQTEKLAVRLKSEKIDLIYSSDLTRAADTAKEIAQFHQQIPLQLLKEIRGRKYGYFEGKKRSEIEANPRAAALFKSMYEAPPEGENWPDVYERAKIFLNQIISRHQNQTVLVVSHRGFLRSLICAIRKQPPQEMFNIHKIENTSISIFEIEKTTEYQTVLFNCTKHLE